MYHQKITFSRSLLDDGISDIPTDHADPGTAGMRQAEATLAVCLVNNETVLRGNQQPYRVR